MVGLNPYILRYDIGFQLSFVAMAGMIFLAPKLEPFFALLGKRFSEIFSTTIAAQIFTLPLLSFHFGRISWVAIMANVLILPLVPACMALTFIVGSVGFTSAWLAQKVGFLLWLLLGYVVKTSKIIGSIPSIDIQYQMSWPLLLGLYLVMVELILLINLRSTRKNEEN
jgi:competence protein ComEC